MPFIILDNSGEPWRPNLVSTGGEPRPRKTWLLLEQRANEQKMRMLSRRRPRRRVLWGEALAFSGSMLLHFLKKSCSSPFH